MSSTMGLPVPTRSSSLVDGISEALSVKYNNDISELRAAGQDIIRLSVGEAFFDLPLPKFDDLADLGIHHYSHSRGLPELRQRLARYYREEFDVPVDPASEIIVTAGSKVAIYMVFLAMLEPGDEVLIPEPFWLSYPEQVRLCRGVPVMVPHDVSVAGLAGYITPRTRAIVINNPNNPSGQVLTVAELEFVHALADRHGLMVIADEAYNEFVPEGVEFRACGSFDPELRHTVTVNSMSKNYGVSGWRVGYVIAHRTLIDQVLKINQHLITCAPTILSWYLAEHFDDILEITRPQIRRVVEFRREIASLLAGAGVETMPGSASFYLFASLGKSTLDSVEFTARLLREHGVSVIAGIAYGASCDRYIRISIGTEPPERVVQGITAVADLIHATSPR
ncbi:MAG TPA: aminotransferase class I/II-fold pyridoxal phosphate-dependent enzyme [Pseudonocardiaceae bacterium]|nr:aminotransferase class I/II-fold pyridoxal phosphate-dependent enzyme [Pseudonocardiaceae bacterium]